MQNLADIYLQPLSQLRCQHYQGTPTEVNAKPTTPQSPNGDSSPYTGEPMGVRADPIQRHRPMPPLCKGEGDHVSGGRVVKTTTAKIQIQVRRLITMNGLDKLKEKIMHDAESAAETKLNEAKKQAEKILAEYKEKAEAEEKRILDDADKKAMVIVRSAESNANLDGKKKILKEKRLIIAGVFEKARAEAAKLSDAEYFEIIYALAEKCKIGGELMMSENDKDRLPADFEEQIKACTKGKISLSKDFAPIKNGFILKNGMTEENCSFDGIMEAREEELQDKTAKLLFSKV